jgi:hypothetical protein
VREERESLVRKKERERESGVREKERETKGVTNS